MKVCRICLSKDGRLYPITSNGLSSLYHQLTGVLKLEVDIEKRLPQWVCAECGLRLMSYDKLRQKSLRTHQILCQLLDKVTYITEEDIYQIDRESNNLLSNLSYVVLKSSIALSDTNSGTEDADSKQNLKIEEHYVQIEVDNIASDFKKETESSDEWLSEAEVHNTENKSDTESDFHSNVEDSCLLLNASPSVKKLLKALSSNTLKADDKKVRLNIKKQIDKYINSNKKNSTKKLTQTTRLKKSTKNEQKTSKRVQTTKGVKKASRRVKKEVKNEVKKNVDPQPIEDVFTVQTLSLEEQMAEFESRRYSRNYADSPFKCNDCFKGFNTEATFDRHKLMHSDKWGRIECKICKRRFRTMDSYCSHMKSHKTVYRCKQCHFTASLRSAAVLHRLKHKGKVYKCPHCNMEFVHKSSYLSHLRIKHVSEFVCEFCGYSFVSAKGVDSHKNIKHGLKKNNKIVPKDGPTCAKCKLRFASDEALNTHMRVSHPQKSGLTKRNNDADGYGKNRIICELCGVETADGVAYKYHFRRHHPNENANNLPVTPKPFTCDQCGRAFKSEGNLLKHALVHTGQKAYYECHDCNKQFKTKLSVRIHIVNVHQPKTRVYSCGICGKEFNNHSNRGRHMVVHSDLRPFSCEICGSSFKTKQEVKAHTKHVHLKKPWPKKQERGFRLGDKKSL